MFSQEEAVLPDTDLGGEGTSMKSEAWAVEDIAKAFLVERCAKDWGCDSKGKLGCRLITRYIYHSGS